MLITHLTYEDIKRWKDFSHEISDEIVEQLIPDKNVFWEGFNDYMKAKIRKKEAFMAIDRVSNNCQGIIAFSKRHNRITFFGIKKNVDFNEVGSKLLNVALNQLDTKREVTTIVLKSNAEYILNEKELYSKYGFIQHEETFEAGVPGYIMKKPATGKKKRGSFHHNFSRYIEWTNESNCPICCDKPCPDDIVLIKELKHSFVEASMNAQGCLWGKCHVLSKKHFIELHDMPERDLLNFMREVRKVGKALKTVSQAVKINYELHGNSVPHLHMHLFPRYIDDSFPGSAIDVNKIIPVPYENKAEFEFFVNQMRKFLYD